MTWREHLRRCKAEYFAALLAKHNGCVRAAAAEAGLTRTSMYTALRRQGLIAPTVRGNEEWRALQ